MKDLEFVHLHVHSEYSNIRLLDSINKIENMVKYVDSIKGKSFALTDHDSLSGHVEFIKTVKELKEKEEISQDFKPILGNEIYLVDENEMNEDIEGIRSNFYHFLLLAKDKKGHQQLREISSRAWSRMFSYRGMDRVPTFYTDIEEVIGDNKGHLVGSTACLGGYFPKNVLKILSEEVENKRKYKLKIHEFVNWCINIFGKDNFYIELQPSLMQEQIEYNKYAVRIADAYGLECIITTDSHYLLKEDREVHKAYLTSDEDDGGDREIDDFYSTAYFLTAEEVLENMSYLDKEFVIQSIENTAKIANEVEFYDLANEVIIPKIPLPNEEDWFNDKELNDIFTRYQWISKMTRSNDIYNRYLISLVQEGIKSRISKKEYKDTIERIDIECKEILGISKAKKESVSSYLITMAKNIDIIWGEANSLVMPGRGSSVGFIIDYLIGITQVNPIKQGVEVPHWRFLSAERPDYPDIDIDVSSHKRDIVFQCLERYYKSIGGDIVRVSTFGTESAKSAMLTVCRGLGVNRDVALYLSSLIPVERGTVWDIEDCYYGNEAKNRDPIKEFKSLVDEHERLLEVAIGIQGLINKRSAHPCGILIVNDDFTKSNALMRTPSGELVSQFNLDDSEYVGNIKYDILNTKTCAMIQSTLEMLVEHGEIEWQGSLRKTYDKYLHPDVIDKETLEMWELLNKGELVSAFQFDSPVGEQALRAIHPKTLLEAVSANNLMRLMVDDGAEQPLEMYVRYKTDISQWHKDMEKFGLDKKEVEIMERHLLKDYGVCSTQEGMMLMTMDEDIAGFNVAESNTARRGVARKIGRVYEEAHQLLYEKGSKLGTSQKLLDYVWDVQIAMQRGYGFSLLHGIAYTYILIQQLNLIFYYPSIFWNTAVLLVESGALEQDYLECDEDEDDTQTPSFTRKEKSTNYGTIAKAIGNMQSHGVRVALPDINKAELAFKPDVTNDEIVFGFKGVMKINNETSRLIMENRPFDSLEDFYQRMTLTKRKVTTSTGKVQSRSLVSVSQLIVLIKAGAFDNVENRPREEILEDFLRKINPDRSSINASTIEKVIQRGIVPSEFNMEIRFYRFRNYLMRNERRPDKKTKSIRWHSLEDRNGKHLDYALNFFNDNFAYEMEEGRDYKFDETGNVWIALGTSRKGSFDSVYGKKMERFNQWLNSPDCLNVYNRMVFDDIRSAEMGGSVSKWEMESMNFYYHDHELADIDMARYQVVNFDDLPEEPVVSGMSKYQGRRYPKFQLWRIVGTVLDRDKTRHSVTFLTPTSVVMVKFYSGQFAFYDRQISTIDEDEKKTVLEEGWFKRGNKLLITGFRRGEQFRPKRYANSIFPHSVQLITDINEDGALVLQSERVNIEEG